MYTTLRRLPAWVPGLLLLAAAALPAGAQEARAQEAGAQEAAAPDTIQTATGGVRIHIRRNTRPRYIIVRRQAPPALSTASPPVPATPGAGISPLDLAQMEARLANRIDRRFADLMAARRTVPPPVQAPPVQTPPVQTPPVQTPPVQTPPVQTPPVQTPPVQTPTPATPIDVTTPTVEYIERAILEQGLFRTVHVNFEVNQSVLLTSSRAILDAVGEVLARHPEIRLEIGGHTDSTGPEDFNQRLSEARAEAVRAYLMAHAGLDGSRLVARGYGETQPIAGNATATERTLNRRVEFRVLTP